MARGDAANQYSGLWFETFLATVDPLQTEKELAFLETHLPLDQYPRVVDLGCGAGRHATPLAQRGYRVVGIDENDVALRTARTQSQDVVYRRLDMRQLGTLQLTVDAVVNLWQSFGQFDDATNLDLLRQIHETLRPKGRLVLDIYNRAFFQDRTGRRTSTRGGRDVAETKSMRGRRLTVELEYAASGVRDVFDWRLYTREEITADAASIGFAPVVACTGFDAALAPSPERPRMQLVFQRA
jgi:SAM-dependent methyltransferase